MPGRVLLVDAVATGRIVLKAKLSAAYYDVIEARTRDTALCLAAREQPDLILLDMTSRQLGAVALCRALKSGAETADIPVMMITAAGDGDMAARALRAQADDYIARPLDDATLLVRVGAAIRNKELTRELELRGDSFRDLGFAEDQRPIARQGRVAVLAATPDQARDLAARIATRSRHRVHALSMGHAPAGGADASGPARMVRATGPRVQAAPPQHPPDAQSNAPLDASHSLATTASGPTTPTAIPTPTPDVFVLILDATDPQAALARLVELQSRRATRHAAIVLAVPEQAVALPPNLGATDIVPLPLDADDLALRLSILIARTLQAEDLRGSVQRGLQMAATDPLTRLYNRRYAQHHLTQIAQRASHGGDRFALMILDIDRFKSVNDSFGHRAGDHVLAEVARRLSENLRDQDLIARYGGEEFLIILPNCSEANARAAAERLRRRIAEEAFALPCGNTLHVTLSIGMALSSGQADCADALVDCADRALYASKAEGRNLVTLGSFGTPLH